MEFAKLHGLGNDFIFFDGLSTSLESSPGTAQSLCDRHFGIGADGVIVVKPPVNEGSLGYMHYINADGTLAQMCGNGVRCTAKYLVDRGYATIDAGQARFIVDTLAGPKPITCTVDQQGCMTEATVNMGAPILEPGAIPTTLSSNAHTPQGEAYVCRAPLTSPWGTFEFTLVSMGNPHAVCLLNHLETLPDELFLAPEHSLANLDINRVGAYFESHEVFPEKTNVEFVVENPDGTLSMRVYERGCGETLACGTGTCATLVAAVLNQRSSCKNTVHLRGGDLLIEWRDDNSIAMTGPATQSFIGVVAL